MNKPSLADRRRELISQCAEQRAGLADALLSMRPSNALGHPVAGFVVGHKKTLLGALALGLGAMLARRKRVAALAGAVMSGWRMAQAALTMLGRYRQ